MGQKEAVKILEYINARLLLKGVEIKTMEMSSFTFNTCVLYQEKSTLMDGMEPGLNGDGETLPLYPLETSISIASRIIFLEQKHI